MAGRKKCGFAVMDKKLVSAIASKGGKAAHEQGRAHEWTQDTAKAAGSKGGQTVSRDRAHMSEIGRKGGLARGARRARGEAPAVTGLPEE